MTKRSRTGSRKRPTDETLAANDVHFPPAFLSDFVIHYRDTAYHVHKFVLCHHSSYFRTYFEPLIEGQRVYLKAECDDHHDVAHCIRLPDRCGKVEADSDDFRVFLCHLYFAQHYRCVPYTVATHVNLDAEPAPTVTLDCPAFRGWEELDEATSSSLWTVEPPAVYEAVMSLCHYFNCDRVLSRAEDNCAALIEQALYDRANHDVAWSELWPCFLLALKFNLMRVKRACIPRLAECCMHGSSHKEQWESVRAQLDRDTLLEVMQAAFDKASSPSIGAV